MRPLIDYLALSLQGGETECKSGSVFRPGLSIPAIDKARPSISTSNNLFNSQMSLKLLEVPLSRNMGSFGDSLRRAESCHPFD